MFVGGGENGELRAERWEVGVRVEKESNYACLYLGG